MTAKLPKCRMVICPHEGEAGCADCPHGKPHKPNDLCNALCLTDSGGRAYRCRPVKAKKGGKRG